MNKHVVKLIKWKSILLTGFLLPFITFALATIKEPDVVIKPSFIFFGLIFFVYLVPYIILSLFSAFRFRTSQKVMQKKTLVSRRFAMLASYIVLTGLAVNSLMSQWTLESARHSASEASYFPGVSIFIVVHIYILDRILGRYISEKIQSYFLIIYTSVIFFILLNPKLTYFSVYIGEYLISISP